VVHRWNVREHRLNLRLAHLEKRFQSRVEVIEYRLEIAAVVHRLALSPPARRYLELACVPRQEVPRTSKRHPVIRNPPREEHLLLRTILERGQLERNRETERLSLLRLVRIEEGEHVLMEAVEQLAVVIHRPNTAAERPRNLFVRPPAIEETSDCPSFLDRRVLRSAHVGDDRELELFVIALPLHDLDPNGEIEIAAAAPAPLAVANLKLPIVNRCLNWRLLSLDLD